MCKVCRIVGFGLFLVRFRGESVDFFFFRTTQSEFALLTDFMGSWVEIVGCKIR